MYVKCCNCIDTRKVFDKMTEPDVSSPGTGSVSANATNRYNGKGILSDVVIVNTLIDMYVKGGSVHKARELVCTNGVVDLALSFFKELPQGDVISLNAMVAGYARDGFVEKALERFNQTRLVGLKPNSSIVAIILPACTKIGVWNRVWTFIKA
ncbi:pentatricopeptide repeat-containing protein At2g45350, chloroplastic-like [Cryptomeria japonica]|uniref:pentatricopeptide repeat-containing protein At2g45350, chloroplastic-like n=1 Tax=Cryptomeria japonica TaxID=3369 RepID=UPI0027DA3153|nr:pentatricopeptide repeat-containing protein At2g45350, chloroplastic-like [Cryptomeria japonica]